jgi:hypothetical protein
LPKKKVPPDKRMDEIVENEFGSEIVDPEFEIVNSSSNAMNIEISTKFM